MLSLEKLAEIEIFKYRGFGYKIIIITRNAYITVNSVVVDKNSVSETEFIDNDDKF